MNICFLARSLFYGGAERQLVALASGLKERGHAVTVVLFYGDGPLVPELHKHDVQVISLEKAGRWDLAMFTWRLVAVLRRVRPEVCHAYLTVPNLVSSLLKPFLRGARLVWGVRASNMDLRHYDWLSRLVAHLEPILAHWADLIIVNSNAGQEHLAIRKFPRKKLITVPNGIDLAEYRPDRLSGIELRREWGTVEGERLIGLVARLDPMKDHHTFLAAAAAFLGSGGVARFICVGDGPDDFRSAIRNEAKRRGLNDHLVWVGARSDMPAVYNALDLVTLTSAFGEGFPNVLAEATACGVPCVATDVGDAAMVLGACGILVPARDPDALAAAWRSVLDQPEDERKALGIRARAHIGAQFGVETMIARSEALLLDLLCREQRS